MARTKQLRTEPDQIPPWEHNPSKWAQRWPVAVLAMVAFGIAVYLTLYQWRVTDGVWDPFFGSGSEDVLDSDVSHRMESWILIPDASLGAFAYLGDAVLALAGSVWRWQCRPWLVIIFGIDVIPLGIVSVVLVVLQGTVVGSWCFLCLVTAVISLMLIAIAYDEVWSCLLYLRDVWRRTHSAKIVWNTFWGTPSPEADEVARAFLERRHVGKSG